MTFILIANGDENIVYPTDTTEQIKAAQIALADAGETGGKVYVGDPDGDHQTNGQYLFSN